MSELLGSGSESYWEALLADEGLGAELPTEKGVMLSGDGSEVDDPFDAAERAAETARLDSGEHLLG